MKTLIINGSPRENGDSRFIIDELSKILNGEVQRIDVYKENFTPCLDCRYCWTTNECSIKDDLYKIYDRIEEFDNVILSSPIYFSELSGPLLSYTSRFQRYFVEKYILEGNTYNLKKKKGAIILSAGGDCRSIERPIETAEIIMRHVNAMSVGVISTMYTNEMPAKDDEKLKEQIEYIGDLLNS